MTTATEPAVAPDAAPGAAVVVPAPRAGADDAAAEVAAAEVPDVAPDVADVADVADGADGADGVAGAAGEEVPARGRLARLVPRRRRAAAPEAGAAPAVAVAVPGDDGAADAPGRPGLAARVSGPAVLLGAALVGAGLAAVVPVLSGRGPLLVPAGLLLARAALTLRAGRPLLSAVLSKAGVVVLLLAVGAFVGLSRLAPVAPADTASGGAHAPAVADPAHAPAAHAPAAHAPAAPAAPAPAAPAPGADPLQQQLQDIQRRLQELSASTS